MKPLELRTFDYAEIVLTSSELGDLSIASMSGRGIEYIVDKRAAAKRLTDAELAAEYWRAVASGEWLPIAYTLHRFATTPSYDEETR